VASSTRPETSPPGIEAQIREYDVAVLDATT
jgi:hypothetical protein